MFPNCYFIQNLQNGEKRNLKESQNDIHRNASEVNESQLISKSTSTYNNENIEFMTKAQNYMDTHVARAILDMGFEKDLVLKAVQNQLSNHGLFFINVELFLEAVFKEQERKDSEAETSENETDILELNYKDKLSKGRNCIICMDALCDTILLPCKHFLYCYPCSLQIGKKCPYCRAKVKDKMQVYAN